MMLQLRCSVAAGAGAGAAEAASSCRRRWPRRRAASAAAGAAAGEASARRPRRRSRGTGLPRSPDRRCSGTATAAICTPNKTRRQQATHTQLARRLAREGTHEGNPMRIRTCGCLGPNGNGSWWATRKTAGGGGGSIWVWGCLELASSCAGHRTRWFKRDKACFIRQHFTRHASLMRNARRNRTGTFAFVLRGAAVCQSTSNAMGTRWSEVSSSPPPPPPPPSSRLPLLFPAELPSDRSRLWSSPPPPVDAVR
jgi:hypothetical protein